MAFVAFLGKCIGAMLWAARKMPVEVKAAEICSIANAKATVPNPIALPAPFMSIPAYHPLSVLHDRQQQPGAELRRLYRTGEIHKEGLAFLAGRPAREHGLRRLFPRFGAEDLDDSRNQPIAERSRRFRRHVAGRKAGAAGGQDEIAMQAILESLHNFGNFVSHDPAGDSGVGKPFPKNSLDCRS